MTTSFPLFQSNSSNKYWGIITRFELPTLPADLTLFIIFRFLEFANFLQISFLRTQKELISVLYFWASLIVTGINIATIAVLLTTAEAIPIVNKYTPLPKIIERSASLLTLIIRYSKIRVFWRALLIINKKKGFRWRS